MVDPSLVVKQLGKKLGPLDGRESDLCCADCSALGCDADTIDTVIFHAPCPDGFAAAFAAWLRLGDRATYIGVEHAPGKEKKVGDLSGKRVAVLDFSFDAATTAAHLAVAEAYVVLDHHASAQEALETLPRAHKIFDMKMSGATLAWAYFHAGAAPPTLLRYIEDKDIWRWAMRSSREFSAAFPLAAKVPPPGPITSVHFAELDALHKARAHHSL